MPHWHVHVDDSEFGREKKRATTSRLVRRFDDIGVSEFVPMLVVRFRTIMIFFNGRIWVQRVFVYVCITCLSLGYDINPGTSREKSTVGFSMSGPIEIKRI